MANRKEKSQRIDKLYAGALFKLYNSVRFIALSIGLSLTSKLIIASISYDTYRTFKNKNNEGTL